MTSPAGARSSAWCPSRTSERGGPAEGEDERGAAPLPLAEAERSTMRLHDPPREEQTDPEPLVRAVGRPLDLREQLEDPVALIERDAGTPIGDLEAKLLVGALRAELDGGFAPEVQGVLRHEHDRTCRERRMRHDL